jgi:hypothetical protein
MIGEVTCSDFSVDCTRVCGSNETRRRTTAGILPCQDCRARIMAVHAINWARRDKPKLLKLLLQSQMLFR